MGRIEREKKTISLMVDIYCRKKHGCKEGELCSECKELLEYAHKRLSYCKFGDEKSTCSRCPIHCYKKDMKEKVKYSISLLYTIDTFYIMVIERKIDYGRRKGLYDVFFREY